MALAAALAQRSDEELAVLLAARPDVLEPSPPRSLSVLATRLSAWPSVVRCLDGLDRFSHQLLAGLCLLDGPASARKLADVLGAEALGVTVEDVSAGLDRFFAHALTWEEGDGIHVVDQLRRAFPRPAGLGPPLAQLLVGVRRDLVDTMARNVGWAPPKGKRPNKSELVGRLAQLLGDPARIAELMADAPTDALAVLNRLQAGEGTRVFGSAYWHGQAPRTALEWLQSRGLVVGVSWNEVEVPREVALALRGARPFPDLAARPPALIIEEAGAAAGGHAQAAAAGDVLAGIEEVCAEWGRSPASVLKAGGLGARELKRVARAADRDLAEVAVLAELSLAAGLLAVRGDAILPTTAFDDWLALVPADRWLAVLRGWMASDRWASLAGQKDTKDKPIPALHPGNRARQARDQRAHVLAALATLSESQTATIASLADRVVWQAPGRWDLGPADPVLLVGWVLEEAATLGVTSGGALSAPARALLAGDESLAKVAAEGLLPPPTTRVTLQADLTALAIGTLSPALAAELHLAADVESKGAATVFRFSEVSIRRALDAGRSAEGLLQLLDDHATKGVPQPLAYLISDVGRRHGAVRAGQASSYLRSDDPALLAQALRSRRAAALGLRQLAPTVLVAEAPVAQVLAALRADGLLPAEEGADGAVVSAQPPTQRAHPAPSRRAGGPASTVLSPAEIAELIARLRAAPVGPAPEPRSHPRPGAQPLGLFDDGFPGADEIGFEGGGGEILADDPEAVFDLLLDAVAVGCPVLMGHDDAQTGYEEEVLEIVSIANGVVFVRSPSRGGGLHVVPLPSIEWAQLVGEQALSVRP